MTIETPILFTIYNRPDKAALVFKEIRKVKPKKLFVSADGPKEHVPGDAGRCRESREIIDRIDWDCDVKTNFSEKNRGCKLAITGAVDWFFNNVEEGIILEDDCVPSRSFFRFCSEMLDYYRNDERIMHITGFNYQQRRKTDGASYYFSLFPLCYGWATWRRAWSHYDIKLESFPDFESNNRIENFLNGKIEQEHFNIIFRAIYEGRIDLWLFQWIYAIGVANGMCVHPSVNLVHNTDFENWESQLNSYPNLKGILDNLKNNEAAEIDFPLKHPAKVAMDKDTDRRLSYEMAMPLNELMSPVLGESFRDTIRRARRHERQRSTA